MRLTLGALCAILLLPFAAASLHPHSQAHPPLHSHKRSQKFLPAALQHPAKDVRTASMRMDPMAGVAAAHAHTHTSSNSQAHDAALGSLHLAHLQQQDEGEAQEQPDGLAAQKLTASQAPLKAAAAPHSEPDAPLVQFENSVPPRFLPGPEYESATVRLVKRSFQNSYGKPSIVQYTPDALPPAFRNPQQWVSVVLTQQGKSRGRQFDRLGSVSIGNDDVGYGVEVWRTDNPEPINTTAGTVWQTTKDVSKYYSLFSKPGVLVFDYPNIVNDVYTGALNITLSLTVHQLKGSSGGSGGADTGASSSGAAGQTPLYTTAPLIYPISKRSADGDSKWAVPGDDATSRFKIPRNARRALIEVSASGTATDEFWYSNVNDALIAQVPDGSDIFYPRGPYREVQVLIDGTLAGIAYPFPVIFTGGISTFFWKPQASHGAYIQPTYYFDVTAFLGVLSDGKEHDFTLRVVSAEKSGEIPDSWFLSGNLQLDVAHGDAGVTRGSAPDVSENGDFSRSGSVHGDVTAPGGSLRSAVRTLPDRPRRLRITGAITLPGEEAPTSVETTHAITYESVQVYRDALNVNTLRGAGVSVQTSLHGGEPFLNTRSNFPLELHFVNDTARHFVNNSLALEYNYEQTLGAHAPFAMPQQTEVRVHLESASSARYDKGGAIVAGVGRTKTVTRYEDSDEYTFGRTVAVRNRTITQNDVSGSLAGQAGPVQ